MKRIIIALILLTITGSVVSKHKIIYGETPESKSSSPVKKIVNQPVTKKTTKQKKVQIKSPDDMYEERYTRLLSSLKESAKKIENKKSNDAEQKNKNQTSDKKKSDQASDKLVEKKSANNKNNHNK